MQYTFRRSHAGQSIVLLALMILVIVAIVGLSVDVGNAYGQQRRLQSVANAGSLAGLSSVLANNTNNGVWADVQRTLQGNRINSGPSYSYQVYYVKGDDSVETLGEWNGSTSYIPNGNASPPANLSRIQINVSENVGTYFARVVGTKNLPVSANGVACLGDYGFGVYPLGIPITLRPPNGSIPGHTIFLPNGTQLSTTDSRWGAWGSAMQGMTVRFPISNGSDFLSGVHISWLNWGGQTQTVDGVTYTELSGYKGASQLAASWTYPGTLANGFLEAASKDASKPNTKPMQRLQRGDWIAGDPGVKASVKDELAVLQTNKTDLMLPFYDVNNGSNGSNAAYHAVNMGHFIIKNFALTGNPKYIDLQYLGNASTAPQACGSEPSAYWRDPKGTPVLPSPGKHFSISGQAKVTRAWRTWSSSNTTHDIVIVMDTSTSMSYDWSDRPRGRLGYDGKPRIDDAKTAVINFVKGYDISAETGDPDARIAFVTFGGAGPGKCDTVMGSLSPSQCPPYGGGKMSAGFDPAVVQVNWTTACAAADIPLNCNGTSNKWSTIQTKANSMDPLGVTPGPIAFEEVENLLRNKRTPPAGKKYGQIVVFATDGVFNVCGTDKGVENCPYGQMVPPDGSGGSDRTFYTNNPGYNAVSGRPIWQAQQVATRIKNSGARIFVIAETPTCGDEGNCFTPIGLPDISSGSGYYYTAKDASAMANIYATIRDRINYDQCIPHEVTQQAANTTIVLTQPNNPTWTMSTVADSSGNYSFGNLPAGQYILKINPAPTLTSPEDQLARTYPRLRNSRNLTEEGQASVYINPQFPDGATVYSEVILSLPYADDGTLNNGCSIPAQ